MLPEGTHLTGSILQAKPVRWLAQNGKLRFTVRGIELPAGSEQQAMEHTVHSLIPPQSPLRDRAFPLLVKQKPCDSLENFQI
jgi:hypothetical protein